MLLSISINIYTTSLSSKIFRQRVLVTSLCLFCALSLLSGCGGIPSSKPTSYGISGKKPPRLGYTIQAGAFNDVKNAVRLTNDLQESGVDAYYFVYKRGVYKVRFGDYPSREIAVLKAKKLQRAGLITDYYIVDPDDTSASKSAQLGDRYLRRQIIVTAKSFLGVPYRWGGESRRGLDCSGLTMAVYEINGLKLPRSSRAQFREGNPVTRVHLRKGDLVFFATNGGRKVSHVGVYTGNGNFIHAPGKGKRVRTDSLLKDYYADRFIGARRYF